MLQQFTFVPELTASQSALGVLVLIHRCRARTGTPLPPKSKSTKRSPRFRFSVCAPVVVGSMPTACWLNSKSMCAEPSVLVRSHAMYKKRWVDLPPQLLVQACVSLLM